MHTTRNQTLKSWPIPRKGTKYIVVPSHNKNSGIAILTVMRDMLKVVGKRKEAEKIMREGKVKVNGKITRDEKYALSLFDIIDIGGKKYKIVLKNKKYNPEETKDNEKIVKITGKKMLIGKKIQINLSDGKNIVTNENLNMGDSVALDFNNRISRKIGLKEGSRAIVISGSHIGEEGKVEKISGNVAEIKTDNTKVNLETKRIMAI